MPSTIEWVRGDDETLGETWNLVAGCAKVSPGCKNCYAQPMTARLAAMADAKHKEGEDPGKLEFYRQARGWDGTFVEIPTVLELPFSWRKPRRVFVNSMSDLFGSGVSFKFLVRVFGVMAMTPQHTYMILTKRPERMAEFFRWFRSSEGASERLRQWSTAPFNHAAAFSAPLPLPNVWLGVSVEARRYLDRVKYLRDIPAVVHFVSCEPQLEPIEFYLDDIDWLICGGESGPDARPFHVDWAFHLALQARAAGTAFFLKQMGAFTVVEDRDRFIWPNNPKMTPYRPYPDPRVRVHLSHKKGANVAEWPENLRIRQYPR